jgi:glycerol-3-phosphate dehydrogenase
MRQSLIALEGMFFDVAVIGAWVNGASASLPLLDHHTEVKLSDLRYAATHEHPANLVDLIFRRVGAGWTGTMGVEAAHNAAETIADVMGWDEKRIAEEAERYHAYVARTYGVRVSAPAKAA